MIVSADTFEVQVRAAVLTVGLVGGELVCSTVRAVHLVNRCQGAEVAAADNRMLVPADLAWVDNRVEAGPEQQRLVEDDLRLA